MFILTQNQCADVVGQTLIIQKTNPYYPEINIDATIGLTAEQVSLTQ